MVGTRRACRPLNPSLSRPLHPRLTPSNPSPLSPASPRRQLLAHPPPSMTPPPLQPHSPTPSTSPPTLLTPADAAARSEDALQATSTHLPPASAPSPLSAALTAVTPRPTESTATTRCLPSPAPSAHRVTKPPSKPAPARAFRWTASPFPEYLHATIGPAHHYFKSFGPTPRMCHCLLFPIYSTKRPAPAILPSSLGELCLDCIEKACTTACGDALSCIWRAAEWEGEYRHYRGFYLPITIVRIVRSRSKAEALALRTDLRQAIEPLMAGRG